MITNFKLDFKIQSDKRFSMSDHVGSFQVAYLTIELQVAIHSHLVELSILIANCDSPIKIVGFKTISNRIVFYFSRLVTVLRQSTHSTEICKFQMIHWL